MKRLLKVTAMTGLLTLLKMVMGFVIAKVVAVYTGPSGMAMLGQVQSMVGCLNGIINAPVGSGIVRYTAEKKDQGFEACAPWWRAALQWVLIISAVAIPTGLLMANHIADWLFQDESLAWIVMATICVLPLSALGTLCNSVINGQQLYRRYVGLGMLSALVSAAVMLTMIMLANIQGALFAAAVQAALIGLVMFIANLRQPWFRLQYWWGSSTPEARRSIGGYMLMAITSALTVPISLILVRTILIHQVGWEATGHWQAVWKISEVYLGVITMALGTYYLPRLSSLVGVDAIVSEIHKTALVILPIVAIMALGVYLLRDVAIWLLFTEEFKSARDLFAIQLCGDVIKIACWLYAYPMLSRGATRWFIGTEIVFSLSFVALAYILINTIGLKGANVAYLVNYSIYFLSIFLNVRTFAR
ncbi:O-antigen translocase [Aeromonas salmonicida]|uniref:WzxE family protein n=1 Tax=Aeromonas salmonicida subsp. pectinolytica 34mel TaxID=1324960 RepID=T0PM32_AERSA|nr:O-antigen translocase [Aeromonas salmonicida]ATP10360.1 wzxE family protein [Aeromonas salmonicida subsp. pectinolytica 34mel]EQC03836.1 WzxB protein [Aeromonas salmonicida subsp. pectinolytica 34mel]TNI18534.1 O-antigen translocase [Aeromonas salmonicida]